MTQCKSWPAMPSLQGLGYVAVWCLVVLKEICKDMDVHVSPSESIGLDHTEATYLITGHGAVGLTISSDYISALSREMITIGVQSGSRDERSFHSHVSVIPMWQGDTACC